MKFLTKKQDEKKQQQQTAKGNIKIKVYMRFGAEVRQLRAEYFATEKRDNYNNLIAINDEIGHNEDIDFSQEDVYSSMNITLGIAGLSKDEALKKIKSACDKTEKRINAIQLHPELNKFANIWDEKRKLREFEIFANFLKHRDSHGTYFKMEDGFRVYEYESVDGFLIPIWHGSDSLSDYPDFTRKKKITMQETANLNAYFESKGSKKIMVNALLMVLLITSALFFVNVYAGFKLLEKHQELDDRAMAGSEICVNQFARTYTLFNTIMDNAFIRQYLEEQEKVKEEESNPIKKLLPNN
jgi:hypothetical protein